MSTELDLLQQAFIQESEEIVVKAEDLQHEGIDWTETFFEPQPNKSYTIKFLKNIEGDNLVHRKVYKALPDPKRKGKTFQYVSKGNGCPVLDAFFDLNAKSKEGNALAKMKIEAFLSQTNQACSVVQILASDDTSEIGQYRLFVYSNFGQNATVANLLNQKLNPSEKQIANGYKREDVFNIFGSSALILEVTESDFGGRKGRDFSKSSWTPIQRGAIVVLEDGTKHEFSTADIEGGKIKAEVLPAFSQLIEQLKNPKISIHNYFAYKEVGDPKSTKETDDYVKSVTEKVEEIIPVILKAASIDEVKSYGVGGTDSTGGTQNDSAQTINGASAANILLNSTPTELDNSVMADKVDNAATMTTPNVAGGNDVNDILNGGM